MLITRTTAIITNDEQRDDALREIRIFRHCLVPLKGIRASDNASFNPQPPETHLFLETTTSGKRLTRRQLCGAEKMR
jgi:hypothetical protein